MAKHYKSVFENEHELLCSIIEIHNNGKTFDCDPMHFKGMFYKDGIEIPKHCFDLNPQKDYCRQGNAKELPFKDCELNSIILDPPFLFEKRNREQNYYSALTHTIYRNGFVELETEYKSILKEAYRVLEKNGLCVFKCQDYTDSKTTLTHCFVFNWALELGFYAKDLAILVKPNKVYNGGTQQRHLRKIHTYFYVFKK